MKASPLSLAFLLLLSCQGPPQEGVTAEGARKATNEHMSEHLPQVDLSERTIVTVDLGDRWRVSYDFPGGATGGPIVLEVSKQSGEVVNGVVDQ